MFTERRVVYRTEGCLQNRGLFTEQRIVYRTEDCLQNGEGSENWTVVASLENESSEVAFPNVEARNPTASLAMVLTD